MGGGGSSMNSGQYGPQGGVGHGPGSMHPGAVPGWQAQGMALLQPAAGGGGGDEEQGGLLPSEIEVKVLRGAHAGKSGKISQVRMGGDAYAVVLFGAENVQVVELPRRDVEPAIPGKKDAIVIIHGDLANNTGTLIGVDGTDGIVKMDTTNDIKIVELRSCAKLVRR